MRTWARRLGLAVAAVYAVAGGSVLAQDAPPAAPAADPRPIVIGEGNRVSGRIEVVELGEPSAAFRAALDAYAAAASSRGLTITRASAAAAADAPIVVSRWPTDDSAHEAILRSRAERHHGLTVLFADPADIVRSLVPYTRWDGVEALAKLDDDPPPSWTSAGAVAQPGLTVFTNGVSGRPFAVVARPEMPLAPLAQAVVRAAILHSSAVRHLPSAFAGVSVREAEGELVLDAPLHLPGKLTLDAVTMDGTPALPPGPLRRIALGEIADPSQTLLRLRFEGDQHRDEARVWLATAVRDGLPAARIQLTGLPRVLSGVPASFRVSAVSDAGVPLAGLAVRGTLGASESRAATDATGAAVLVFEAQPPGRVELGVTLRDVWCERRLGSDVSIVRAEPEIVLQTDRRSYRPGSVVRHRAIVLDASDRPAAGASVELTVRDPRSRVVLRSSGISDRFGVVAGELPLAPTVTEGQYVVEATGGGDDPGEAPATRTTFLVEDIEPVPFDVRVDIPGGPLPLGKRLRGVVSVREWDGLPAGEVSVTAALSGLPSAAFVGSGDVPFDLPVADRMGPRVQLRVTVCRSADRVVREVVLDLGERPAPPRRWIEAPAIVEPGVPFDVRLGPAEPGLVDVDLVAPGRVLASASCAVGEGDTIVTLVPPPDATGGARVVASVRGESRRRALVDVRFPRTALAVAVEVPAVTAPGEDVVARVRVRDEIGAPVTALLDVRAVDRAAVAVAGLPSLQPASGANRRGNDVELLDAQDAGWFERDLRRAAADAAAPVFAAACAAAERGERVAGALPWGSPLWSGASGGDFVLLAEGPAISGPAILSVAVPAREPGPAPALLLPVLRPAVDRDGPMDEWFVRHQSADGSFDPSRFDHVCLSPECRDPGPSRLHVATTALVTYAFLRAGFTHQSGRYKRTVREALEWLERSQAPDGFIGDRRVPCSGLNHALATLALAEAEGMTQSVLFRDRAQRAVNALVAMQREDGGFGEPGAAAGGPVLGAVAALALDTARTADLRVPGEVRERLVGWLDAQSDRAIGAPRLPPEETDGYLIGTASAARAAAAAALVIRSAGQRLEPGAPGVSAATATLLVNLPFWDTDRDGAEPISLWLGSLGAFSAGGDVWSRWNLAMQKCILEHQRVEAGSCARGSWDSVGAPRGRMLSTALCILSMELFYRYGRVFGSKDGGGAEAESPRVRRDFPDLLLADLALPTDEHGAATVPLRIPDTITTWDVDIGAWDREGRYGHATAEIRTTLPLFASARLPKRLVVGDVVHVPVRVRSSLEARAACSLTFRVSDGLTIVGEPQASVSVEPGATASAEVILRATASGRATLRIDVAGGGQSDAVEVATEVVPLRTPAGVAVPVVVGTSVSAPSAGIDDAQAVLRVTSGTLGAATAGLRALLRRPTGCLEQTCSTLATSRLAWTLLGADRADPAVALLRQGVQTLYTFEAPGGGFALYPDGAPTPGCTTLALDELLSLRDVATVDDAALARSADHLASHLPASVPDRIAALAVLRRSGRVVAPGDVPDPGDDVSACATALAAGLLDGAAAARATDVLVRAPVPSSNVETTAMVVEALARTSGHDDLVRRGLESIRAALGADGAWNSTRATRAALRALAVTDSATARGRIVVEVAGREPVALELAAGVQEVRLGAWKPSDAVTVRHEGSGTPWMSLVVSGTSAQARAAAPSPLVLDVQWPREAVRAGDRIEAIVTLRNASERDVAAPLVVLPIPAGFEVVRAELPANQPGAVELAEVQDGTVRLYSCDLPAGRSWRQRVALVARTAGTVIAPAATAYPYYDPEAAALVPAERLSVSR